MSATSTGRLNEPRQRRRAHYLWTLLAAWEYLGRLEWSFMAIGNCLNLGRASNQSCALLGVVVLNGSVFFLYSCLSIRPPRVSIQRGALRKRSRLIITITVVVITVIVLLSRAAWRLIQCRRSSGGEPEEPRQCKGSYIAIP